MGRLDLENLSPGKKGILLVLPSVAIIVVAVVLFVLPGLEEKNRLSAEIEKQKSDIKVAQQRAERLKSLIAENERLKNDIAMLQLRLPEEREVSGLLRQVSEYGIKSGLQILSWRPKEKVVHASKEVYEIPVDVEMRGHYHNFGQFFSNVTRLNRIVNLSNIRMAAKDQQKKDGVLSVSFTAMTYSLIPENERKQMEKKEKEKAKK